MGMSDKSEAVVELVEAAKQDRHLARVERHLVRAGVALDVVERAALLVTAPVGAVDSAIIGAVDSLRREVPSLFESHVVKGGPPERSAWGEGRARARRRFGVEEGR